MKLSLGLKVGTSLSLTPQLQQAIRLLQLSSLELEQEIQTQLDSNPLLEVVDDQPDPADDTTDYVSEFESASAEHTDQTDVDVQMAESRLDVELPVDTQWDDVFSHQSTALATPEFEEREDNRCAQETVVDHLLWQLNLSPFSPVDRLVAECIIDGIDERGYLIADMAELLQAVNQQLEQFESIEPVELDELEVVLKRIQHFDPAGVAARDLAECLALQLRALPAQVIERDAALRVLQHHQLLVSNELARLLRATQLTEVELKAALQLIKSL
ncbi:MAG: RNA polymerase factor sigma-54, partial [Pseudomonadota bacterium]|nr:RNA polymerase factor sigma-54 [Pseudomonadota bacterium]